ncbi:MAG TPA: DUF2799 domain-containing protein [Steroidobacteraceae bacterium]
MKMKSIAWVLASVSLAGCAAMSKNECRTVDWRTVGYEDGVAGRSGDTIGRYRVACANYGVVPNLDAYQSGRSEGLREYCRPQNGFNVGENGGEYTGLCPADLAPAFTASYESGRELHRREYRAREAQERLDSAMREIPLLEQQLASLTFAVIDPQSTGEQRANAILQTRQIAERHEHLRAQMPELERERQLAEQDLAEYRARLASN